MRHYAGGRRGAFAGDRYEARVQLAASTVLLTDQRVMLLDLPEGGGEGEQSLVRITWWGRRQCKLTLKPGFKASPHHPFSFIKVFDCVKMI